MNELMDVRVGEKFPNGCRLVSLRPGLRFLVDRDEVPVLVFVNDRVLPCREDDESFKRMDETNIGS